MVFETERLVVRLLAETDLTGFYDMHSNPKVMQFTSGKVTSLAENKEDLQKVIQAYSAPANNFWIWAVERKNDGAFVGTTALIENEEGENEIGYRLREKYWGNGYGKEVAAGLIRHGFEGMGFKTLVAYVFTENHASVSILERNMVLEKEFYNKEAKCMDRKYRVHAPLSDPK